MLERGLAGRIFQPSVHRAAFRPAMWTQWWRPGVRCAHMKYLICPAPKCGQTTCKQAWRAASPEIRCPPATHMHRHTRLCFGNVPANVPTHDKPVGLQMLTQTDINAYNKTYWEHGNTQTYVGGEISTKTYFLHMIQSMSADWEEDYFRWKVFCLILIWFLFKATVKWKRSPM